MSYEISVIDPAVAATRESAYNAWNDQTYYDTSKPVTDYDAPKWRIKDALLESDTGLVYEEPAGEPSGLAKIFSKEKPPDNYLTVQGKYEDQNTTYHVFDHAVEIDLPWDAETENVEKIVQDLWRNLGKLQTAGFTTLYDGERNRLLDLENDFEAVMKGYRKNIGLDDDDEGAGAVEPDGNSASSLSASVNESPGSLAATSSPEAPPSFSANQPFTGNADPSSGKPWWKFW